MSYYYIFGHSSPPFTFQSMDLGTQYVVSTQLQGRYKTPGHTHLSTQTVLQSGPTRRFVTLRISVYCPSRKRTTYISAVPNSLAGNSDVSSCPNWSVKVGISRNQDTLVYILCTSRTDPGPPIAFSTWWRSVISQSLQNIAI